MADTLETFRARDDTELTPDFWNRFLKEVQNRLGPLEGQRASYDATLGTLKGMTLQIVQSALADTLALVEEQTKLAALMVFLIDGQTRTMQQGEVTFTLAPEEAALIEDAGYVTLVPKGSPHFRMTGPIVSLDEETGEITVNIVSVQGTGAFEEWTLGVGFLAAGREGINFRGTYDAEADYVQHDAVYYATTKSSYVALVDAPAGLPGGAGWNLLAGGGTDGEDGDTGVFTEIATEAEAAAGVDNEKGMTALRVAQAIAALVEAGGGVNVQVFDASDDWIKPDGAAVVDVILLGAGGGGGSGARYSAANHGAGGGGQGGGISGSRFKADDLPGTVAVTVGAGGAGGAATTVDSTNGSAGSAGGDSSFGGLIKAKGGAGGAGGTASGGAGGSSAGQGAEANGNAGGNGSAGSAVGASVTSLAAPVGGNGGGGITTANNPVYTLGFTTSSGALILTSVTPPAYGDSDGEAGQDATHIHGLIWFGGAGGAPGIAVHAGKGGDGYRGSGGGGGGASLNGFNSGAGGDGGDGLVIVITYLGAE